MAIYHLYQVLHIQLTEKVPPGRTEGTEYITIMKNRKRITLMQTSKSGRTKIPINLVPACF